MTHLSLHIRAELTWISVKEMMAVRWRRLVSDGTVHLLRFHMLHAEQCGRWNGSVSGELLSDEINGCLRNEIGR